MRACTHNYTFLWICWEERGVQTHWHVRPTHPLLSCQCRALKVTQVSSQPYTWPLPSSPKSLSQHPRLKRFCYPNQLQYTPRPQIYTNISTGVRDTLARRKINETLPMGAHVVMQHADIHARVCVAQRTYPDVSTGGTDRNSKALSHRFPSHKWHGYISHAGCIDSVC